MYIEISDWMCFVGFLINYSNESIMTAKFKAGPTHFINKNQTIITKMQEKHFLIIVNWNLCMVGIVACFCSPSSSYQPRTRFRTDVFSRFWTNKSLSKGIPVVFVTFWIHVSVGGTPLVKTDNDSAAEGCAANLPDKVEWTTNKTSRERRLLDTIL